MVCFTKRGHRQDGNDYDEGDLGLESPGQGGFGQTLQEAKGYPRPLNFCWFSYIMLI